MFLEVGKIFHGFKIIERCGSGGYGEVYLAEDILERRVALKVVEKQASTDSWEQRMARTENLCPQHRFFTSGTGRHLPRRRR